MKKFKIITCANTDFVIGNEGKLLYHIPNDLKNFQRITIDNVVIMGRKTFESLPNGVPLHHRINIIVTNDRNYSVDASFTNVHIVHSIESARLLCEAYYSEMDWYIIGGGMLYNEVLELNLVDTIYITTVNDSSEGDTYFPNVFFDEHWKLFYQSYTQRCRPENLTYTFAIYKYVDVKNS